MSIVVCNLSVRCACTHNFLELGEDGKRPPYLIIYQARARKPAWRVWRRHGVISELAIRQWGCGGLVVCALSDDADGKQGGLFRIGDRRNMIW